MSHTIYAPESNHHDCNFNSTPNIPTPIPTDKKIATNDSLTIGVGLLFLFLPPPESGSSELWIGLSRARVLLEALQNWGKFYPTFPVSNGIDKCYNKSLVPCAHLVAMPMEMKVTDPTLVVYRVLPIALICRCVIRNCVRSRATSR